MILLGLPFLLLVIIGIGLILAVVMTQSKRSRREDNESRAPDGNKPNALSIILIVCALILLLPLLLRAVIPGLELSIGELSAVVGRLDGFLKSLIVIGALGFLTITLIQMVGHSKHPWRWLSVPIVIVGGFCLLTYSTVQVTEKPPAQENTNLSWTNKTPEFNTPLNLPKQSLSALWQPEIDEQMPPDLYPSEGQAALALARQCADRIRASYPEPAATPELIVCNEIGDAPLIPYPFVESVYEGLRDALPQRHVTVVGMTSGTNAESHPINIAISRALNATGKGEATGGRLIATLDSPGKSVNTFSVSYENKLWLPYFNAFQRSHPDRQFLIVYSIDVCTSRSQTHNLVLDQAAGLVGQMIINNVKTRDRLGPFSLSAADLQDHDVIQDQFAQSLQGKSGQIWREALLLDVSSEKLARLLLSRTKVEIPEQIKTAAGIKTGHDWRKTILSLLAVLGTVFVLYGFLQAATRGNYRRTLIAGAVILIVGGLCIIAILN